jgi:hypothetical protein
MWKVDHKLGRSARDNERSIAAANETERVQEIKTEMK